MEADALLKTRRSVRRYRQEDIPRETLREIADVARYAPSGGNVQKWEIIVVDEPEMREQVYATLSWLPSIGAPAEGERPVAYMVVLGGKDPAVANMASLVSYILLAAHERGIGSCWFGSIRRAQLAADLNIPEDRSICFVVSLGYPEEEFEVYENSDSISVEKKDGVTLIPKKALNDIIHQNSYGE